jgi:Zn-dependent peptidase ImmA (M78 family)
MSGEYCKESNLDIENPLDIGIRDILRMEWQANTFASCLLLPQNPLVADFFSSTAELEIPNKGYGFLYLDNQKCNLDNYYRITNILKQKYQVSRSVLKIRLKKLGLINEPESIK